jgi:hypothetical protein
MIAEQNSTAMRSATKSSLIISVSVAAVSNSKRLRRRTTHREHRMSRVRACRLVGLNRSSLNYESKRPDDSTAPATA